MTWKNSEDCRAWFRARYEKNRQKYQEYKLEKGCMDCGYKTHHAGLELDHVPGKGRRDNVSSLLGRGWNIIQKELARCDVVCGTCHNVRTWTRKQISSIV